MKNLIKLCTLATLLFTSCFAMAYPSIHDYAKLSGSAIEANGKVHPFSVEMEIIDFDQVKGAYKQRITTTLDGRPTTDESMSKVAETFNGQTAQELLARCSQHGGKLDDIQVPAGLFHTCAMPVSDSDSAGIYWLTDIPFGIAQMQAEQKDKSYKVSIQLESVRLGQ
jgi:hypothetical protein